MMVRATLRNGVKVVLDEEAGATTVAVIEKLAGGSLTGSAVPLDDVWVKTKSGGAVRFTEISLLDDVADYGVNPEETRREFERRW